MTSIISPLRYPGSKRRLAGHISELLRENQLRPELFVEPFAGGASVSLRLLEDDSVQRIGLIEKDPLVASFWKVVFSENHAEWLKTQIREMDVTIDKWKEFKATVPKDLRNRALACLFLNRTSFSGILAPSSGPLGGYEQQSDYPIDCRFPRDTLIKRIEQANSYRDRVAFVWEMDWAAGLERIFEFQSPKKDPRTLFFYFDPPFFHKAEKLYRYYFENGDHEQLRNTIVKLEYPWALSYDYCESVDELYAEKERTHIEMLYSASQNGGNRKVGEVLITNLDSLPSE